MCHDIKGKFLLIHKDHQKRSGLSMSAVLAIERLSTPRDRSIYLNKTLSKGRRAMDQDTNNLTE